MKILFIVNALNYGGAERVCSELASYFSKLHNVSILITSKKQNEVYSTGRARIDYINNGKFVLPLFKTYLCYKWMKINKPDVVIAFPDPCSFYGSIPAKKLHIPCICSERNAPMYEPQNKIMRIMRLIAYRKASAIVFQTHAALNWFPNYIKRKGVVIWNPYEHKNTFINQNKENIDALVTVGRITPQKNHTLLIKAFKKFNEHFPKTYLHIFGSGAPKDVKKLKDTILEYKMDKMIILKGFSSNLKDELIKYPVFVMSSNYEGMPNALIEASISGLSCVSTDCPVGGPHEILCNCSAHYLVPCNNPEALSKAMIDAYQNRNKNRDSIYKYATLLSKKTSIREIANKWLELIGEITIKYNK